MARKSLLEQLGASAGDVPDEPLDAVPEILARRPKPTRAEPKRNRDWEARQRKNGDLTMVAYRGIPISLRDAIKTIAQAHGVRVNDVARLFLEYGLDAYESGLLTLNPKLEKGRLTLFPQQAEELP